MLTRIAPIFAVANWTMVHSAQFGAQMPTRSPFSMPAATKPQAATSTSRFSSAQVHRVPCSTSGASVSPAVYDRAGSAGIGDLRDVGPGLGRSAVERGIPEYAARPPVARLSDLTAPVSVRCEA